MLNEMQIITSEECERFDAHFVECDTLSQQFVLYDAIIAIVSHIQIEIFIDSHSHWVAQSTSDDRLPNRRVRRIADDSTAVAYI